VREVALALVGVHGAAGEHPSAAHEALRRVALDEQHLERLRALAQEDHGRRLPGRGGGTSPAVAGELVEGDGTLGHPPRLADDPGPGPTF
jgi:hypothetical protein